MVRVIFKDKYGNKLVEDRRSGKIGVKNRDDKYVTTHDINEFIKENRLGNKIRLKKGGMLWVHNELLN